MKKYYSGVKKHLVAVDCIVFGFDRNKLRLLIVKRKVEPYEGKRSLMGGFVGENEDVDAAAHRVLRSLTGITNVFLEQLHTYGDAGRDPGARVISAAYYALIRVKDYNKELGEKHGAYWIDLDAVPKLIFDHSKMVMKALERLQEIAILKPVGEELLPAYFTLPQLQMLHEAIYGKKLDKRNFRKKILSSGTLKVTSKKDKSSSRRGAYLYQFKK